jgi:hypothetical protein
MNLQVPKEYLKYKDPGDQSPLCIIRAPAGSPLLDGYVMKIPQHLVSGSGPYILIRHGNERTEDGKTYRYMLEKENELNGDQSPRYRFTTAELSVLYKRAETAFGDVRSLTGSGRLIEAAYADYVPGTRVKYRTLMWLVIQDKNEDWAYVLKYTVPQDVQRRILPLKDLDILNEFHIDDIPSLLKVENKLINLLKQNDHGDKKEQIRASIGSNIQ